MAAQGMFATQPAPSRPERREMVTREPAPTSIAPRPTSPRQSPARNDGNDELFLAILDGAPLDGETIDGAFRRKERELGAAFAELGALDARTMHARLAHPRSGDVLAARFSRLVVERRGRLLAFLADARRREALRR